MAQENFSRINLEQLNLNFFLQTPNPPPTNSSPDTEYATILTIFYVTNTGRMDGGDVCVMCVCGLCIT